MITVNLDMDGVIYDFEGTLRQYVDAEEFITGGPSTTWDLHEAWGVPIKEFYRIFHDAIEWGVFGRGRPLPGALDAIDKLIDAGYRVRIVTSKKFPTKRLTHIAQVDTVGWLRDWDILHRVELCFTNNKQGYQADLIVDDKPTLAWVQPGRTNILFAQPWNDGVVEEGVVRGGWDTVLAAAEGLTRGGE